MTAVQMFAGALAAHAERGRRGPPGRAGRRRPGGRAARAGVAGTLLPFALFAWGQSRVAPELAGAFLNLEPLVGAAAGALAFGDPFGAGPAARRAVILRGIALSTVPPRKPVAAPVLVDRRHEGRTHRTRPVRSSAPRDARHLPHAERTQRRNTTYQATPLLSLMT